VRRYTSAAYRARYGAICRPTRGEEREGGLEALLNQPWCSAHACFQLHQFGEADFQRLALVFV